MNSVVMPCFDNYFDFYIAAVRPVLGSIGTIERIVSLFEFEHLKPVHYSCIGVLKNLTAGMNGK